MSVMTRLMLARMSMAGKCPALASLRDSTTWPSSAARAASATGSAMSSPSASTVYMAGMLPPPLPLPARPPTPRSARAADDDVGVGAARQHAQENALADARAGHDAPPLPLAAGQAGVHGADAQAQRPADAPARHGVRRQRVQRHALVQGQRRPAVDGAHGGVDDPAPQRAAHRQLGGGGARPPRAAPPHPRQLPEPHQPRPPAAR